jgi:hypothetical protein
MQEAERGRCMNANTIKAMREGKASAISTEEMLKQALEVRSEGDGARITAKLVNVPKACQKLFIRAMTGKSKAASIKFHCLECCGYYRNTVRDCTCVTCGMFMYRPYQEA